MLRILQLAPFSSIALTTESSPISLFSKKMLGPQPNYSTFERESRYRRRRHTLPRLPARAPVLPAHRPQVSNLAILERTQSQRAHHQLDRDVTWIPDRRWVHQRHRKYHCRCAFPLQRSRRRSDRAAWARERLYRVCLPRLWCRSPRTTDPLAQRAARGPHNR